jgi:hypothetical protein
MSKSTATNRGLQIGFLMLLWTASSAFAGLSGICFVYQPLTTLGTDAESKIVVARIPIICSGSAESVLTYISAPHQLLQRGPAIVEDSNLLSSVGISVEGEWVEKAGHYLVTLDLSQMKRAGRHALTDDEVVFAAVKCIRRTIDEIGQKKLWKVRIIGRPQDGAKWQKYETDYRPRQ